MDYELKYKNALEWARMVMSGETGFIRKWVLNNIPYNKHKEEISGLLDQIKDL